MEGSDRSPWTAGLLGLLCTGLGHVYVHETMRGVRFVAALQAAVLSLGLLLPARELFPWPLVLVLPVLGIGLGSIVDAAARSRRAPRVTGRTTTARALTYAGWVVGSVLLSNLSGGWLRDHRVQAFRIPAESMTPTLLVGDYMFVDRRPDARRARRGDLVAFRYPQDPSKVFVKRVVAVAGDRVESRAKRLRVNREDLDEPYVVHLDPEIRPGRFDTRDEFGPVVVPRGHVFLMGDNRDRSNDSRYFGPVPEDLLLGRVIGLYWSWSPDSSRVRWERVGRRW